MKKAVGSVGERKGRKSFTPDSATVGLTALGETSPQFGTARLPDFASRLFQFNLDRCGKRAAQPDIFNAIEMTPDDH
jgi:hypothetical protein